MGLPYRNTADRYGLIAQLLHWAVVAGIALQYLWAWRMDEADSMRAEYALVVQHKSIGMTILALVLVRLAWRLCNRPPALPAAMPFWEKGAAGLTHWLLYALILIQPLSGWMYTSAEGYGAEFFGLVDIPGFVPVNDDLADVMEDTHETIAIALPVVIGLHVAAALKHHFIDRDDVLRRMLPKWK